MPLQAQLPQLLKKIYELAGATKRIYLGGSSGGFAALYYSFVDPGSVCIAVNPQTDLISYSKKAISNYLEGAWPGTRTIKDLEKKVAIDLSQLYARGFQNFVIYLQSVGDIRHYGSQMPKFCQAGLKNPNNFIINSGYWGVPGHSNSIPSKNYYPWVKSVVAAPWFDRQVILDTHYALVVETTTVRHSPNSSDRVAGSGNFTFADLLRDYHLRQPLEGLNVKSS